MKKKLDTRFPAARIKKIMQSDEDVGKIAMAVPLLVSKALELFLQDLCDRTYHITVQKGAKTLNSSHLKQCVQTFNVFDFLRDIVSKVPDLGGHDVAGEEFSAPKRRKIADIGEYVHEDPNSDRVHEASHATGSGRRRGRGKGRGRGLGNRAAERETIAECGKFEDDPGVTNGNNGYDPDDDGPEDLLTPSVGGKNVETTVHDFDLNVDLHEGCESKSVSTAVIAPASSFAEPSPRSHGKLLGLSPAVMEEIEFDPTHVADLHRRLDEDEEDYDEET